MKVLKIFVIMSMNLNIGFNKDEKFVSNSLPLLKAWGNL